MKTLTKNITRATVLILFALLSSQASALSCSKLLIKTPQPVAITTRQAKLQTQAEKYASGMQNRNFSRRIQRKFISLMVRVLLKKNLGDHKRVSEETTKDIYDETVTAVKALLDKTLITDAEISKLNAEIKTDRETIQKLESQALEANQLKEQLETEVQTLEAGISPESAIILTTRDNAGMTAKAAAKQVQIAELEQQIQRLERRVQTDSEKLVITRDTFQSRQRLRNDLTRELIKNIKAYEELPLRIQKLIDTLLIRGQRIKALSEVKDKVSEDVILPELNAEGRTVWVSKPYNLTSASAEVNFLMLQVKNRGIRKQIRELLNQQANLHRRLTIYKDFLIKAKAETPENFGRPKERILSRVTQALSNISNFPGYTALLRYERKILIEEFKEAFNIFGNAQTPKTFLRERIEKEGGAALQDFREKIGAVKNTVAKQTMNSVRALLIPVILGAGASADLTPTKITDLTSSAASFVSESASGAIRYSSFQLDALHHYRSSATELSKVPKEERPAWLLNFTKDHGIDITTDHGAQVLRTIVLAAKQIDTKNSEVSASEKAEQEEVLSIIEDALGY